MPQWRQLQSWVSDSNGTILVPIGAVMSTIQVESSHNNPYTVIRNCMPNARVIRMTVAKLGLPFSESAL